MNEQKRWNLEEIVHNIKVSESGSNHAIVPVIGTEQESSGLQSPEKLKSADPVSRDRVKSAIPRRRNRKHQTVSHQNDKTEFKEIKVSMKNLTVCSSNALIQKTYVSNKNREFLNRFDFLGK